MYCVLSLNPFNPCSDARGNSSNQTPVAAGASSKATGPAPPSLKDPSVTPARWLLFLPSVKHVPLRDDFQQVRRFSLPNRNRFSPWDQNDPMNGWCPMDELEFSIIVPLNGLERRVIILSEYDARCSLFFDGSPSNPKNEILIILRGNIPNSCSDPVKFSARTIEAARII